MGKFVEQILNGQFFFRQDSPQVQIPSQICKHGKQWKGATSSRASRVARRQCVSQWPRRRPLE